MILKQKFIRKDGSITLDKYEKDTIEARDIEGNYLYEVYDISDKEWITYIKLGHKKLKNSFDEAECFEQGLLTAIENMIKEKEKCRKIESS